MALFDSERKRIVIRVVYDGPGHAGKTTNLQRLCKSFASWRRSDMVSPNTIGERTQYFDWLEVDGGLMQGYPIRAQLLTVPGQTELFLRRQFVIEHADVVVFVADSQPEGVDEARSFYTQLCEQLARFEHPVPVVFQANKQDVAGALRPRELARRVCEGLVTPAQVRGSVASDNSGVKQTLALALRIGSEVLRQRWAEVEVERQRGEVGDADTTLAKLEHHEAELARGRPATLRPTLPHPELPTTQIWPPVGGRALISALHGRALEQRSSSEHPERLTLEVETAGGRWRMVSGSDRLYVDQRAGLAKLLQLSSRKVALGSWLAEPCAAAIVADPEGHGVWLWTIDPVLPSLELLLHDEDPDRRHDALMRFAEVVIGAEALAERHGLLVELDPSSFAVDPGGRLRTRYAGHDLEAGDTLELAEPILALARRFASDEIGLADYAEVLCLGLYETPVDPERRARLRQALTDAELVEPGPRRVRDSAVMVLRLPAEPRPDA